MARASASWAYILLLSFFAFPFQALAEQRCDSDFYDLKISMAPEEFADLYINTMLVPELDRDEQAVWLSVVRENLSPNEAANRHVEQFYSMESSADLASRLEEKAAALERIRELVQVREYSDPPVDWLVEQIRANLDVEAKIKSDFEKLAGKYRKTERPKVIGSARAWYEAYGPAYAIGSCDYFERVYNRARELEKAYYKERSMKETSSHELDKFHRVILPGDSYERIMLLGQFNSALRDELRQ